MQLRVGQRRNALLHLGGFDAERDHLLADLASRKRGADRRQVGNAAAVPGRLERADDGRLRDQGRPEVQDCNAGNQHCQALEHFGLTGEV